MDPDVVEIPTRTLVLGMARADGRIVGADIYPVAEACGLTLDQVRSCLRRLGAEGLFDRDGEGRDVVLTPREAGLAALEATRARTRLAYAQDVAGAAWDGRWRMVAFAVPEGKRAARDALRDRLVGLGGAPVQNGLYVSSHDWTAEVASYAAELDVVEHLTQATTSDLVVGGLTDPRAIARRLWALDELAERYQRFVDTYTGVPDVLDAMRRRRERLTEADFLPGALVIGVRFNECFDDDPLLPPELLPRPWPGRAARDLLLRSRRLGIRIREDHDRPALFSQLDDVFSTLP